MRELRFFSLLLTASFCAASSAAASSACIQPDQALQHVGKDVCVQAHVYRVVDAAQQTRFLDVCSPETRDADCHFFIVSLHRDAKNVGDLSALSHRNIHIRGRVRLVEGRAEIVLSRKEQLHGGKEKFRANPKLLQNFAAENGDAAIVSKNGTSGQHGVHFQHGVR